MGTNIFRSNLLQQMPEALFLCPGALSFAGMHPTIMHPAAFWVHAGCKSNYLLHAVSHI